VLIVLLGAVVALADDLGEPVRVELKAHAGCPDSNAFFAEMRARTTRVRRPNTGEKARTFKVTIKQVGSHSVGELAMPGSTKRTVTGDSCSEVVAALAFVAALSVDPNASPTPLPSTSVSAPSSSIAPPVASSASVAPTISATVTPTASTKPPEARPARVRLGGGVGVALVGAQSPGTVLATPVHFEAAYERDRDELISPALRASFSFGRGGLIETPVGRAYFKWTYAALDACPIRKRLVETLYVRPCVGFEGGTLAGGGLAIAFARNETRPWLGARLLGRIDWTFLDTLSLEVQIGAVAPFTRDEFVFDPSTLIYRAPALMPFAVLGLGVRFP